MPSDKEISQQILRYLYTNANGISADAIKKYQEKVLPGFGIMYPQLKELAKKYNPSNAVALELMTKKTREARMMAIILAIPEQLSSEDLYFFIKHSFTEELQNLLARHILTRKITIQNLSQYYSKIENSLLLKTIIQNFRINKELPAYCDCILLIEKWFSNPVKNLNDGKHLAEAIYRHYLSFREEFIQFLQNTKSNSELESEINEWLEDFKYL